jgi:hypothetical protein
MLSEGLAIVEKPRGAAWLEFHDKNKKRSLDPFSLFLLA